MSLVCPEAYVVRKTSYRFSIVALFSLTIFASSAFAANLQIVPSTTRTIETSNNTSAPNSISSSTSGYAASGNISKLPIRSLLYPGATSKIYAALMGWWGKSGHISIGENSQDPAVVKKQVEDMQSRGIDGAILAWYGKGTFHDVVAQQLKTQAEAHQNFSFIIMIDQGTIQWDSMGMAPTDALIYHLNYMAQTYYSSPAYAKINGRPIVLEFNLEAWPIDWTRVMSSIQGNPIFFFRNPGAFTNTNAFGGYGWGPANGLSYTDYFNKIAGQHTDKVVMADAWKGFNDVLASWSKNRVVDQQCGQTWLASTAELSKFYSSSNQLPFLQIPTWNDYEEGTTIESGIDNCVSVTASASGNSLQWQLGGAGLENTIDHYTAFISTDGENLMPLKDIPIGTYSLDLSQFDLAAGNYTFYVKAVGKASLKNQMSNAAAYAKTNVPPTAAIVATPSAAPSGSAVTASTLASTDADGNVVSSSIDFGDGAVLAGPTAAHSYTRAGSYTITATVMDNSGGRATATTTVTAQNRAPVAALNVAASAISGAAVTASTAGSSDPDGTIASSTINFGDGSSAAGPSASHTYATPGTYTVSATVTDNLGATASTAQTVTITNRAPNVVLGLSAATGYTGVQITATTMGSSDADGTIASTSIDFGDGNVSAGPSHTHQYANAGTFTVTATVTDNQGATSTATSAVVISPSTVQITLPATQPNAATPLNVKAVAYSGRTITGMYVYVDNVAVYNTNTSSLNVNISVKAGTHLLLVKAWDNTGRILSSQATLDVAAGSIAPRTTRTGGTTTTARLSGSTSATDMTADSPRARRLGR
jgi:PKD repeat protein